MRLLRSVPLLFLLACASTPSAPDAPPAPPVTAATTAPDAPPVTAATTGPASASVDPACLAAVDGKDGTVDKVIARCPNCGLTMDGKAEFSTTLDGYEAHSCSAHCKEALEAEPAAVLARSCKRKR